jgi:hypothetical protein
MQTTLSQWTTRKADFPAGPTSELNQPVGMEVHSNMSNPPSFLERMNKQNSIREAAADPPIGG